MREFILQENVLSDNTLKLADKGKIFKGGYIAIIKEYEFNTAWTDKELPTKKFRSIDRLLTYIKKKYKEFDFNLLDVNV